MPTSTYQPKLITVTNLHDLDDIKSSLFNEIQRLAEHDRLSNDEIDRLSTISDQLVAWQPDLEEQK